MDKDLIEEQYRLNQDIHLSAEQQSDKKLVDTASMKHKFNGLKFIRLSDDKMPF